MSEPADPKVEMEELCKPNCVKQQLLYEACTERIKSDPSGQAHCTGQYFDFWDCVDKCAAKKTFALLK